MKFLAFLFTLAGLGAFLILMRDELSFTLPFDLAPYETWARIGVVACPFFLFVIVFAALGRARAFEGERDEIQAELDELTTLHDARENAQVQVEEALAGAHKSSVHEGLSDLDERVRISTEEVTAMEREEAETVKLFHAAVETLRRKQDALLGRARTLAASKSMMNDLLATVRKRQEEIATLLDSFEGTYSDEEEDDEEETEESGEGEEEESASITDQIVELEKELEEYEESLKALTAAEPRLGKLIEALSALHDRAATLCGEDPTNESLTRIVARASRKMAVLEKFIERAKETESLDGYDSLENYIANLEREVDKHADELSELEDIRGRATRVVTQITRVLDNSAPRGDPTPPIFPITRDGQTR